jgi:hypothetical protein
MHFILFVPIGLIAGALAGRVVGGEIDREYRKPRGG